MASGAVYSLHKSSTRDHVLSKVKEWGAEGRYIAGVNKKPKKFKTVWHGFRGILKLSAGFSNTVC